MNKIIIVDDEIRSVEILKKYIETYMPGYCVSGTYYSGRDALEAFTREPSDIAVIDIEMSVIDGISLIREMNKVTTDYVPIILSGYETFEYAKSAMKCGVEHYLSKPVDFCEIKRALEEAADKLRFRRLLHSDLTFDDDEQEAYFASVLGGWFSDREKAVQRFAELSFPFQYEPCCGTYFEIQLEQVEKWSFGKETLFNALRNLLLMVYSPVFLVPIQQKRNLCSFVMVTQEYPDSSLLEFIRQGKDILKADMTVKHFKQFASVEQLRNTGLNRTNMQITASELEDYMSHKKDISKVIDYINEHYSEDLSRSAMAKKIYMSDAYFSRCFKAITNDNFKSYLTKIRMEKAIELLNENLKIQDIAHQVGYSSHTRFSIVFRQYTSYTPSEYRAVVLKRL